jgi:outer membrane protein OmpA-like peptidoglycan-associated protein
MKKSYYPLLFLLILVSLSSPAQDTINYYVTIGAFSHPENAIHFVEVARKQGLDAEYAIYPKNKLHFVYVLNTTQKRAAYALAIKLRAETEHKDAWVFEGQLGEQPVVKIEPTVEEKTVEPDTKPNIDSTQIAKQPEEVKPVADSIQIAKQPSIDSTEMKPIEEVKPAEVKKPAGKPFYFKLVKNDGGEIKSGQVHIQETINASRYQAFSVGEVIYLEAPKNNRGTYTVVTQVPGYSPVSTVFEYKNLPKEGSEETVIELPMNKVKKGDYIDFNNVKFYKNASILQAPSQNELDGVVDLLKENPKYRIKIHGHVNGNQERESFVRGPNSSFFATNPSADQAIKGMSSKDLSIARAESIRDYLISQGIETSRISTKGEGGKIPLYPEGGSYGYLNDRVEIEFIKH